MTNGSPLSAFCTIVFLILNTEKGSIVFEVLTAMQEKISHSRVLTTQSS